jgi:hypothetical protein
MEFVSECYNLNAECLPQSQCVKCLVPQMGPLGGGAQWKILRSLGLCTQREMWVPGLFLVLALLPGHDVSSVALPCTPAMKCYLTTDPKQWGQLIMAQNLQNCEPS